MLKKLKIMIITLVYTEVQHILYVKLKNLLKNLEKKYIVCQKVKKNTSHLAFLLNTNQLKRSKQSIDLLKSKFPNTYHLTEGNIKKFILLFKKVFIHMNI